MRRYGMAIHKLAPGYTAVSLVYCIYIAAILHTLQAQTIGAENTSLSREPVMEFPYFIAGTAFPCLQNLILLIFDIVALVSATYASQNHCPVTSDGQGLLSSLEKCTFVINGSDTVGQNIDQKAEEEIEKSSPCVIQGHLDINHNWHGYLAKVKLHPEMGKFYYKFTYPQRKCCIKILLYLSEQVDKLKAHMSCIQKQSTLDPLSPQVISLSPSSPASGCIHNDSLADGGVIECTSGRLLRSDIEREWNIAAASCGSPTGLNMQYSLIVYGLIGECPQQLLVSESPAEAANIPPIIICLLILGFCTSH